MAVIGALTLSPRATHCSVVLSRNGGAQAASTSSASSRRSTVVVKRASLASPGRPMMPQNPAHWAGVSAVTPAQPSAVR